MSQPPLPRWHYSPEVINKARGFVKRHAVTRDRRKGIYWVQGSAREPYRVSTDADPITRTASWITCTCPHGANAGAGDAYCSHAVAVLVLVRDGLVDSLPVRLAAVDEGPRR